MTGDALGLFLPAVAEWFRSRMGTPTPVQQAGWPVIAAGESALLLAPTGSGKTLAAFLACLDGLWRWEKHAPGIRILYISPLKALNNDIYRNLQVPLEGVAEFARQRGDRLPTIDVAVRTGDTPTAERVKLLRRPPQVLITTPESLHLLLTSKARDVLKNVSHCIVDEIHALCPNKRGVFLSLLLERLQVLNPHGFARIGLSATQRPLEEVARYLGGLQADATGQMRPRPVTIVDAGLRKHLDLQVICPVEAFGPLPEKTIWPSIYRSLAKEVLGHRSTIIFANNRRSVERITSQVNEVLAETAPSDRPEDAIAVRAHHGSVSLEMRQQTELALKEGRLRGVVATASLEMGIDMGAVDLVCQVESPGNVARALQRVGRAGHLVGQHSKGRLIPKTLPDLLNQAVLAAEMKAGRVEAIRAPVNCLDILAQQIVAMVAMEDWPVEKLFQVVRQSHAYRDLTSSALDSVLEMVTGRFRFAPLMAEADDAKPALSPTQQMTAMQPRISWDRVHHRLQALPGSQRLALMHGGTIPDTGQYAVYTRQGVRVGEVDEEFVYERRVGDTFLLGTSAWRIDKIDTDRVLVDTADGAPALVPFWRGEGIGRSFDLGVAQGKFLRSLEKRINDPDCIDWLKSEHCLDSASAVNLRDFVRRQLLRANCLPTDETLFLEASRDPLGDWQVLLLSPFGHRLHLTLRFAIENHLRRRLGYRPQCLHHDDGLLIRLTESEEPVVDLFKGLAPESLRTMVLDELADSALFALRFRQNAARALMMPRGAAGKRAPLWLQRLRGRDLLQVARQHADFPIVIETFRECLNDHLDLPRLEELVANIHAGTVQVRVARLDAPSPFAANLMFGFTAANMYNYDGVQPESGKASERLDQTLLDQLLNPEEIGVALDPRAVQQVDRRLRGVGAPPRSAAEMAEWLRRVGDVAASELEGKMAEFLRELAQDERVVTLRLPGAREPDRWILAEEKPLYQEAFEGDGETSRQAATTILLRFLATHALVGLRDILDRYPFDRAWAEQQIQAWAKSGRLVAVPPAQATESLQWSAADHFAQMQRGTLSLLRREVVACPPQQFADFLLRWQKRHPAHQMEAKVALADVLEQMQGLALPWDAWETALFPSRLPAYQPGWLDELLAAGNWVWVGAGKDQRHLERVRFFRRDMVGRFAAPDAATGESSIPATAVLDVLRQRGALFTQELAALIGATASSARQSLWDLLRLGLVSNDRFDVARRGEPQRDDEDVRFRSRREITAFLRNSSRRSEATVPEGRWSTLPWGQPDTESAVVVQAWLLLNRYGVVARELALMEEGMPAWRVLYEVLSRMELAGEVRRGYFVEGLSGAQFALPDAAQMLQESQLASTAQAPAILLPSLDPANLYGSGAPFDVPMLGDGDRTFLRRAGNWLVMHAGRPVLLIEQQGRRLTAPASAAPDLLRLAVACLPEILKATKGDIRRKLTVETWNELPVTTTVGREWLEQASFVRDYQSMTLYSVWS